MSVFSQKFSGHPYGCQLQITNIWVFGFFGGIWGPTNIWVHTQIIWVQIVLSNFCLKVLGWFLENEPLYSVFLFFNNFLLELAIDLNSKPFRANCWQIILGKFESPEVTGSFFYKPRTKIQKLIFSWQIFNSIFWKFFVLD